MKDEEIVNLYIHRNERALMETQVKYSKKLLSISENILKNRPEAEECENDTYLCAWNNIPPIAPKQYFFAYLAKIIRNLSFNVYKKNHRQKRSALVIELSSELEQCLPAPNDLECQLSEKEFLKVINGFLHALRDIDCQIFLLRYWYCESLAGISNKLDMSEGTIKSSLFRTRNKLKGFLEKEGYHV